MANKLYADEIISEYQAVLSRVQFSFRPENIAAVINAIERFGIAPGKKDVEGKEFPDPKDIIFYEVALSKEGRVSGRYRTNLSVSKNGISHIRNRASRPCLRT